jgi:hypothetical protein
MYVTAKELRSLVTACVLVLTKDFRSTDKYFWCSANRCFCCSPASSLMVPVFCGDLWICTMSICAKGLRRPITAHVLVFTRIYGLPTNISGALPKNCCVATCSCPMGPVFCGDLWICLMYVTAKELRSPITARVSIFTKHFHSTNKYISCSPNKFFCCSPASF